MKVRSLVTVGVVSAVVILGLGTASRSAAAGSNQSSLSEERVGHGGSIFYGKTTSNCGAVAKGVSAEERVGHGGSLFSSQTTSNCDVMAKGALVEERVGHGGSVYYRQSARQTVN